MKIIFVRPSVAYSDDDTETLLLYSAWYMPPLPHPLLPRSLIYRTPKSKRGGVGVCMATSFYGKYLKYNSDSIT